MEMTAARAKKQIAPTVGTNLACVPKQTSMNVQVNALSFQHFYLNS